MMMRGIGCSEVVRWGVGKSYKDLDKKDKWIQQKSNERTTVSEMRIELAKVALVRQGLELVLYWIWAALRVRIVQSDKELHPTDSLAWIGWGWVEQPSLRWVVQLNRLR